MKKRRSMAPIFLSGEDGPALTARALQLAKQNWRCATCNTVPTGTMTIVDSRVVCGTCRIAMLRSELREEVSE